MAGLIRTLFLSAFAACLVVPALGAEEPRIIVGLYANHADDYARDSRMFGAAELPLNYLGLMLEPYHVRDGIPDIAARDDVRGALIWLERDDLAAVEEITRFVEGAVNAGIPVIIMENLPETVVTGASGMPVVTGDGKRALALIGVQDLGGYQGFTFDTHIVEENPDLVGFERGFDGTLPPVGVYAPAGEAEAGLVLERTDGTRTTPVMITPRGAFVAPGYAIWTRQNSEQARWYVNPFYLFSRVYKTDGIPRADPTTLSGRRIYYSHVDGDGWLNVTHLEGYAAERAFSSEVILREAVIPYPDLPVTIAPVAGDLDPRFLGNEMAQNLAREFFALPQVEPGSHTYTHPFQWSYFAPGNYSPAHELQYRRHYMRTVLAPGNDVVVPDAAIVDLGNDYLAPRAYGDIPFNIMHEIPDSAAYISTFAPPDKPVRVIQWSGDTAPFAEAIAAADNAGLLNINGGDSLRDVEYPSYLTVAPFGRLEGGYQQVYASGANENLYTGGWLTNFSGFRNVLKTMENTNTPRRVSAANVYYHIYSGEREASLRAVREALDAVSGMEIAPVATSRYIEFARGFYSVRLEKLGEMSWRVDNRGELATLRFDDASALDIDLARSDGVLGARHDGSVLYVSLDDAVAAPVVSLKPERSAPGNSLVLDNARWEIWRLERGDGAVSFAARGFGPGEMVWLAAPGSVWEATSTYGGEMHSVTATADDDGWLSLILPRGAEGGVEIRIARLEGGSP